MIDENINDGDIILVKQQGVTKHKQGVVALITDYEKRLERFQKKQEKINLKETKKLLKRKKCPTCGQKEDLDGRCKCVNQDAW